MQKRRSLRFKVALVFSVLTILLLVAQALGVKTLAEAQEERLIDALIDDDITNTLASYRSDPALLPQFDARLNGYVSRAGRAPAELPTTARDLPDGTHEIIVGDQEIHVAISQFDHARLYRVYDFSAYERRFKLVINALMTGTGIIAVLTIWLAYGLAGVLVRQVAGLAQQVRALRFGKTASINPGRYDEVEVAELADAFNAYHQRMADMVEREKAFTGNVSHELRTPLTVIKTSCELLDHDASIGAKSRARIRQMEQATDHMREVVNALLMLARETPAERQEPVGLQNVINAALAPFLNQLAAKRVDAVLDVDPGQLVTANRAALAIVLSNVIDNAARQTAHGHIRFSYGDGRLSIEDTGTGIARQALPHVFTRLYQTGPEEARVHGFGIGLAIVKKICDQYGWPIELQSEIGQGTCVTVGLAPASASTPS